MRILLVSQHCMVGGAETFMLALSAGLQAHGHHCELFFFRHGEMERYFSDDFIVHFGDLADCMRLVKRRQFDVVHGRNSDWEVGLSVVGMVGAKLVVTSHGYIAPGWKFSNCDAFATCAKWLADALQPLTDVPLQVVLNGVDTGRFTPAGEACDGSAPIVAWVGRGIDPRKGIERFAAIAPLLWTAGLRVWLIEPNGREAVAKVNPEAAHTLVSVADFWGPVAIDEMTAIYQRVANSGGCIVATASWEGLPLSLLEAQACGCPVIAPDVRGTNECVDPRHGGTLYPLALDSGALAQLVIDILHDTDAMRRRRRACVEYVRAHFSLERMTRDYLGIYQSVLAGRRGNRRGSLRTRFSLSPIAHWAAYVEHRWSPGQRQYEAAQKLAAAGEWALARTAARASLTTSPTSYIHPQRLALLARAYL